MPNTGAEVGSLYLGLEDLAAEPQDQTGGREEQTQIPSVSSYRDGGCLWADWVTPVGYMM